MVPLVTAAIVSAFGWLVAYIPEPAPRFYVYLLPSQRKHFFEFCRLAGRMFGLVFAGWMVFYSVVIIVDLLR